MKIAILGFAGQGQSAYEYWSSPENQITICDANEQTVVPEGVSGRLGPDYLKDLEGFDLLVRTPALHPKDIQDANPDSPNILQKVTTVTNEFFRVSPSKNIIGVTGTKGKGTTSSLITRLLQAAGKTVHLGGNIGIPPLDLLKDGIAEDHWVVLELANFQLIDLGFSPKIGVCLMVVPEHLNWHADMDEYIRAKQGMFKHQTVHDLAIFNRNNAHSKDVVSVSPATKVSYEVPGPGAAPHDSTGAYVKDDIIHMNDTAICHVGDVALLGRHNLENVCAAIAATWELIGQNTELIKKTLEHFTGLEHRLEKVREVNGVTYYDDSFGTTPETAIVAIQAFDQPKVLILGGSDKGATYEELAQVITSHNVRHVLVIGETSQAIKSALDAAGFSDYSDGGTSMAEIIEKAATLSQKGDVVLLSTACASFDMFKNYKDRGEQFKSVVKGL